MDVLLFQVDDRICAVDAEAVREVVDPVPVTPLPFVPQAVEGLVNISGRVVSQICAARRLSAGKFPDGGEGTVMLLSAGDQLYAFRVSRVIAKITVPDKSISRCAANEAEPGDALLAGEFLWENRLVVLLDPAGLSMKPGEHKNIDPDGSGLLAEVEPVARGDVGRTAGEFPCVLFSCNGELFAFRFDDVAEVVESGSITPLPGAPSEMPGVLLLRGFPLPVIDMNMILFGWKGTTAPYTLVVDINGYPLGLQIERIVGIQRFPAEALRSLPDEQSLLEGFVTTRENRLVGLIRFAALSEPERLSAWKPFMVASDDCTASAGMTPGAMFRSERMLMFRQGREMMAIRLEAVERIEEYSEPTATPGTGTGAIAGIIQVQGNVTPVIMTEHRTGLSAGTPTAYLIVRSGTDRVAVPVEKVERVIELREQDIEPVRSVQHSMLSGVGKYNGMLISIVCAERLIPA